MTAPVLVIDDGELETVRAILDQVGAEYDQVRGGSTAQPLPIAERLLIASARAAIALRIQRSVAAGATRAAWIVFVSGESKTQRAALQKAGFDYLIREPVHPAALRVLLQRALFRGSDSRRAPRVACGHGVTYKTGFWKQKATLVELSPRGCRLLTTKALEEKAEIRIQISKELAGGKALELVGSTVRIAPVERDGAPTREWTVGVRFGLIEGELRTHLRAVLAERVLGPAVLTGPLPGAGELRPTPAQAGAPAPSGSTPAVPASAPPRHRRAHRRAQYAKKITAMEGSDAYMLLCRDLSIGGMRIEPVEDLAVGAKLDLAIQASAREEPFLVEATVIRDDGEHGLALRFDWIAPDSQKRVKALVDALPAIEPLQDDARGQGTILAQRLAPRPK